MTGAKFLSPDRGVFYAEDPLDAARGTVNGLIIGVALWVIVILGILWVRGCK